MIDVAQAQTITLGPGEERTGIDIRSVLVRSSRVEGVTVGPDGRPVFKALIGLANLSAASLWSSPGAIPPGEDGRWVIPSIAPGRYLFFGTGAVDSGPLTLWTQLEVDVGEADVRDATLQFLPGTRVTGASPRLRTPRQSWIPLSCASCLPPCRRSRGRRWRFHPSRRHPMGLSRSPPSRLVDIASPSPARRDG